MGEGIKLGGGASGVVNAVIDEFLSVEGDISPNTFVEFLTDYTIGTNAKVSSADAGNGRMNGCVLDDNRAFVITTTESDVNIRGAVVTFSGLNISVGAEVVVGTGSANQYTRKNACVAIDSNRVFIAYNNESDSRCGRVLSISGTTITLGTPLAVDVASDSPGIFIAEAMPNDYVYLIISDTLKGVQGVLFKVNGTSLSVAKGTHTIGANSSGSTALVKSVKVDDTRIFVYYVYWNGSNSGSTNYRQRGVVVTVSGGTATVGTVTELSNYYYFITTMGACLVSENKILCVFHNTDNAKSIQGYIVTINGSSISVGTRYTLVSFSGTSADGYDTVNNVVRLRDGVCALISENNQCIYFLNVVGTEIEVIGNTSKITIYDYQDIDIMSGGRIVVWGKSGSVYYAQVVKYINGVRPSATQINGMTRTRVTADKPGKVWILP